MHKKYLEILHVKVQNEVIITVVVNTKEKIHLGMEKSGASTKLLGW